MAKKQNHGKMFEEDFKKAAEQSLWVYRLRDPATAFGQDSETVRFSWRNICDFLMFKTPRLYLIECKSHKGSSVPFKAIKNKDSDHRVRDMSMAAMENEGLEAWVIFNWREHGNKTVAVSATDVDMYIESEGQAFEQGPRKSIPMAWTLDRGRVIGHRLKIKRYHYFIDTLING